ncbi:hypothetical protein ACFWUQ_08410 [Streptomyces sp. NPDC058662]|uniref:hypothetical protein n=1 Tax=Streptomyces sp. NPDC058662 TaxID=3346583 RepID=UPI00365C87C8
MADERDRWLDRAAADRLLRGEPVEPVGPAAAPRARTEAARLRAALDALAGPPPPPGELPGEAAALAAYRAARPAAAPASAGRPGTAAPPGQLVEIGLLIPAPRRRRAVRFGLAAALASVAVGGLAAAAGAGLLDVPRHDTAGPGPALSVSADGAPVPAGSEDPALVPPPGPTPSPPGADASAPGLFGDGRTPEATERTYTDREPAAGASQDPAATSGAGKGVQGGKGGKDERDGARNGLTDGTVRERERDRESRLRARILCEDYRAGHLNDDRRKRLSDLAGSRGEIAHFCESVLDGVSHTRGDAPGTSAGPGGETGVLLAPTPSPGRLQDSGAVRDRR